MSPGQLNLPAPPPAPDPARDPTRDPTLAGLATYRLALDLCPIPMALTRPDGIIAMTNSAMDHLFDFAPDELPGCSVDRLVPSSIRGSHHILRAAYNRVPTKRAMGHGRDLFGITRRGREIAVEVGLDAVDIGEETWTLCSVIDISERKASESRLMAALNASASAMILVDGTGAIQLVNNAACALFRATHDTLVGRPVEDLIPRGSRQSHAVYRTGYFTKSTPRPMCYGRTMMACRLDGTEVPVEIGLAPIMGAQGQCVMATISDVSARIAHDEEIFERTEALSALNEELTQFAYSTSHDLKAPLSTISGLLEIALEDLEAGELDECRATLRDSLDTSRRYSAKVEAIFALASAGTAPAEVTRIDVAAEIRGIWARLSAGTDHAALFTLDCDSGPGLRIAAAPFRIIVENLLSNALRFRRPGNAEHSVTVTVRTGADGLDMQVADTGTGISEENLPSIFGMFRTYSPQSGHGIGLALVAKHIRLLNGRIDAFSSPDGSSFSVWLPLEYDASEPGTRNSGNAP